MRRRNRWGKRAVLWLASGLLTFTLPPLVASAQPAAAPHCPLVVAGSGTNLPVMRALAERYTKSHPGIAIEVPASIGSTGGIRAAADGAVALGLISRPLREKEKGLGLTVHDYGRTPLLIAVHPGVAEENITHAELLAIYRGEKNRWRNGREIIVLTREPGDSSIEVLIREVPGFREVYEESRQAGRWTTLLTDLVMNEALARTPYAIGLSDLGALMNEKHAIKPLKVNGVEPTLENLRDGKYTLYKTLSFVYRKENLSEEARRFIDFVHSEEGKNTLLANGYLPEE